MKKSKIILMLFLTLIAMGVAQSKRAMEEEKKRLKQALADIKQKSAREKKLFERYVEQKKLLIAKKKEEVASLDKDMQRLRYDLNQLRRDSRKAEIGLNNFEMQNQKTRLFIRGLVEKEIAKVEKGIPFDKARRTSILMSLIKDIEAGVSGPEEVINRLNAFYETELSMAYDSAIVESLAMHEGKRQPVKMLRFGRVLFYQVGKDSAYPFVKKDGRYQLSKTKLSINDAEKLRNAMDMMDGKTPPDLLSLPVFFTENGGNQ